MKTRLVIPAIALIVLSLIVSVQLVAATANSEQKPVLQSQASHPWNSLGSYTVYHGWNRSSLAKRIWLRPNPCAVRCWKWPLFFLKHATATQVEGSLITVTRNILVLTSDDGTTVRVIVPPAWLVDGEVKKLQALLEDEVINVNDYLIIDALKASMNGDGFTAYIVFGYKINDSTAELTIEALLPFNIEVSG